MYFFEAGSSAEQPLFEKNNILGAAWRHNTNQFLIIISPWEQVFLENCPLFEKLVLCDQLHSIST